MRSISYLMPCLYFLVAQVIIYSNVSLAHDKSSPRQRKIILSAKQCLLTGEDNGAVKVRDGDKTDLDCTIVNETMTCGNTAETYEVIPIEDLAIINSRSGNIKMILDFGKKTYSLAQVNLIIEKGLLMTKQCVGKIK